MPTAKPSLRFFHSSALRLRTNKLLTAIETDADPKQHVEALSTLVIELAEAGMTYYYIKPVEQAKLGFVARQTAGLGIAGSLRVMGPIVRNVLGGADAKQLRVISKHMRALMK